MEQKYNVYGIGNALVDTEFTVTKDFLEEHDVKKGVMTLVDEETQFQLIEDINKAEMLRNPGGSAANTMMAVSQLGGKAFYSCKVADDPFGDVYLKNMQEAGIATNFDRQQRQEGITGKCLVMVTEDADRTMNTFLGITASFSPEEVDEQAIKQADYVYIEGYLVASESGFEAMKLTKELAEKHDVKTSITLSDPSIVEGFKERFTEIIGGQVDLLFCNEEEAKEYTGAGNLEDAAEQLKQIARQFTITRADEGALIFDGEQLLDIDPHQTKAVDTNGAGDMFAGAFLYGITHGMSHAEAAKLANRAGSKVVSQYGPRLTEEKMQALLG